MSTAERWKLLTKPQQEALLMLERAMPLPVNAGRDFLAFRSLQSKRLAEFSGRHNHFAITQDGLALALYGKQASAVETKAERIERLYREAMKAGSATRPD